MLRIRAGALRAICLAVAVIAAPALADTSKVLVTPLARSAAFWFRLDEVAPNLFSAKDPGPWMDVGRWAILEWRVPGTTTWKRAQDFVRIQSDRFHNPPEPIDPRMATMLFGLEEGKAYEYRVRFEGAGYPNTVFTGTFKTLTTDVPHGSTATVTITKDTPNIWAAIKAALGSDSTPKTNKVIEFAGTAPGVHTIIRKPIASNYDPSSSAFMWMGTPDGWLTLQGKAGDDLVLDGSDADYDVVNAGKWIRYTDANVTTSQNIYRTAVQYFDPAKPESDFSATAALRPMPKMVFYETTPGGDAWRLQDVSIGRVCITPGGDYDRLQGVPTLNARAIGTPNEGGFCADGGYVYVHLHNGIDPNMVHMKIPVWQSSLDLINTQYLKVKNLKIQYFRGAGDSRFGGIHLDNSSNIVIEGCEFKGVGTCIGNRTAYGSIKNNIVIKNNRFLERGLFPEKSATTGKWVATKWEHIKCSVEEYHAVFLRGFGISVIDNTFVGMNNGVTGGTVPQSYSGTPIYDATQNAHSECWEIDDNSFFGITDDCVEMETWAVCVAVTRNKMARCYDGWSVAPLIGGPQYFLRNTWVGRGEYEFSGYKQHMTKFGNDDPGDTGYKLMANNTSVNVNDDPKGLVLTGISASGASYNTHIYNNYIACDAYPVEWCDGSLGYPHIFNGNRYVAKRMADAFPGYGKSNCVGLARIVPKQDVASAGMEFRISRTWNDWQMGKDLRNGYHYPNYQANPTDLSAYLHSTHSSVLPWTHDPDSKYSEGTHSLTDPLNGNFKPLNGSDAIGLGVPLANITVDCGTGWAAYEEPARPTAGAIPGTGGTSKPNAPPIITLPQNLTGTPGTPVVVPITYSDTDGTVTSVSAAVSDAAGATLASTWLNDGAGKASITFTPPVVGTWRVAAVAQDDKGATTVAQIDIPVAAPELPGGSLTVSMTPSKQNPKPGEPVIYTVIVSNPTDRIMKDVVLKQAVPAQVILNAASAMLDGKAATITAGSGYFTLPLGDMAPKAQHTITVTTVLK